MNKTIAVLPGDGIGPEVTREAQKALEKIAKTFGHQFEYQESLVGGASLDKYDSPLTDETIAMVKQTDAILFGAVGDPKYDNHPSDKRPEVGILKLRKSLGLFANLRPVSLFSSLSSLSPLKKETVAGTDLLVVRELIGGIYFGEPRERRDNGTTAVDTSIYTKEAIKKIAKLGFELAKKRKKKVTSVDKANVLETSRLWRETVTEIAKDFPDVTLEHMYVDNASMQLIRKPSSFDVILTENMFGDILSDETSVIGGSIGLLPSASIGDTHPYLYEPIHGSAPKHAGQNKANPIGAILSAAMLLRYSFNLEKEAKTIEQAVEKALEDGNRTYDIAGPNDKILSTSEMGDIIADKIGEMTND